ncbi:hypothetical protein AMAG_05120 [Allomyces macrogynus ATCC 38327]|uniref:BZIP domain-containing protein n=1 Tax=Allomyces macrogynus (strain ATCC 38327) TaxID=578462 RepID=A0A0L0S707_ALLM3|nr:hypothetical protein AMAG_05120 [Allomyces macrogynus ATCC 38327]|eukprot:KNE58312.1 hypothetical protein AMAG_05120 [Allomyces macrogynus ATCC 38327]
MEQFIHTGRDLWSGSSQESMALSCSQHSQSAGNGPLQLSQLSQPPLLPPSPSSPTCRDLELGDDDGDLDADRFGAAGLGGQEPPAIAPGMLASARNPPLGFGAKLSQIFPGPDPQLISAAAALESTAALEATSEGKMVGQNLMAPPPSLLPAAAVIGSHQGHAGVEDALFPFSALLPGHDNQALREAAVPQLVPVPRIISRSMAGGNDDDGDEEVTTRGLANATPSPAPESVMPVKTEQQVPLSRAEPTPVPVSHQDPLAELLGGRRRVETRHHGPHRTDSAHVSTAGTPPPTLARPASVTSTLASPPSSRLSTPASSDLSTLASPSPPSPSLAATARAMATASPFTTPMGPGSTPLTPPSIAPSPLWSHRRPMTTPSATSTATATASPPPSLSRPPRGPALVPAPPLLVAPNGSTTAPGSKQTIPTSTKKSRTKCKSMPQELEYPDNLIPINAPIQSKTKSKAANGAAPAPRTTTPMPPSLVPALSEQEPRRSVRAATKRRSSTPDVTGADAPAPVKRRRGAAAPLPSSARPMPAAAAALVIVKSEPATVDEDEGHNNDSSELPVDLDTLDPKESKRIRNTLSARKSRARKAAKINFLEERVNKLEEEVASRDRMIAALQEQLRAATGGNLP